MLSFANREETFPLWNEGALSEYTITVEYQDSIGNRYRVAHSYRNTISELVVTRHREGKWEILTSPPT